MDFSDVQRAADRIAGIAHRTPVMTSRTADEMLGAKFFFKCENFQRAGAFKFRGAHNALSRLGPCKGVLTYSSGNHAQALALAGQLLGIPVAIIMPNDAPATKVAATKGYGGEVLLYDREQATREELGQQVAEERGLTIIPPFDHPDIIAGQGTATKELIEETGELDYLIVPCGGGGLLSGSCLSARALSPKCKLIGVEPEAGDDGVRSFHSKSLLSVRNPVTIADGARTTSLGSLTFPIILSHAHDMVSVPDAAIVRAMRFLWERMKLIVEPTGALGLAAIFEKKVTAGGRVGVILSGGNVDLGTALQLFSG